MGVVWPEPEQPSWATEELKPVVVGDWVMIGVLYGSDCVWMNQRTGERWVGAEPEKEEK
jgi:hypothetical protein